MDVVYDGGLLTVKAERADVVVLLRKIADLTGFTLEVSEKIAGSVSIRFSFVGVEDAVSRILAAADAKNFAAVYDRGDEKEKFRLRKIVVREKGSGDSSAGGIRLEDYPRSAAGLQEYMQKKYGNKWEVETRRVNGLEKVEVLFGHLMLPIAITDEASGRELIDSLLSDLGVFLQMRADELVFAEVKKEKDGFGYNYAQVYKGVPVAGTIVSARLRTVVDDGKQSLQIINRTFPGIDTPNEPLIAAARAIETAGAVVRTYYNWDQLSPTDRQPIGKPELLIYPKPPDRQATTPDYAYYLVWSIDYPLRGRILIDAVTGAVVSKGSGPAKFRLQANLHGMRAGDSYLDNTGDLNSVGPLQLLQFMPQGQSGTPPLTQNDGSFALGSGTGFPIYVGVRGQKVRVFVNRISSETTYFEGDALQSKLLDSDFPGQDPEIYPQEDSTFTFYDMGLSDRATVSDQYNAYHQIMRGLLEFFEPKGITVKGKEGGQIEVWTGFPLSILGNALGSAQAGIIRLTPSVESSDVILHELTHLAVESLHTNIIGDLPTQQGVSEGIADFGACSINRDSSYNLMNAAYDISAVLRPKDYGNGFHLPGDWDGDKEYDGDDWSHYGNGKVVASVLWDLVKGGAVADRFDESQVFSALQVQFLPSGQYSPESLYEALRLVVQPSNQESYNLHLWKTYALHGMNLSARRWTGEQAGLLIDWLPYYGRHSTYKVERSTDVTFPDGNTTCLTLTQENACPESLQGIKNPTCLIDRVTQDEGGAQLGVMYYYRVTPTGNGAPEDLASNIESGTMTGMRAPTNFRLKRAESLSAGAGFPYRTYLTFQWEQGAGPGTSGDGYVLLRTTADDGTWETVLTPPLPWGATEVRVEHRPTVPGSWDSKYTYRVVPYVVGGDGVEHYGPPSNDFDYPSPGLDLAVVVQSYFPYYNYSAGYLHRYRESLKDLLTSLNGSSIALPANMSETPAP